MKNSVKKIALLLMLMTASGFTACDESGGGDSKTDGDLTIAVTGITLDKSAADIHFGVTEQLTATITPADAANLELRWTSSDEAVATVSETGLVTAKEYGVAAIIVSTKDSGFTASCNVTVSYALRDTGPAGGFIFSKEKGKSGGWVYKEAAPVDQSTGIIWSIYNGQDAHSICSIYSVSNGGSTYDDWYLPSKAELNKMYINLKKGTDENGVTYTAVGNFAVGVDGPSDDDLYWSSSESSSQQAWWQDLHNGVQLDTSKEDALRVRAVRSF